MTPPEVAARLKFIDDLNRLAKLLYDAELVADRVDTSIQIDLIKLRAKVKSQIQELCNQSR